MSKSSQYFYDAEAIKEKVSKNAHARGNGVNPKAKYKTPDGWDTKKGAHGSYHREGREKGKTGYTHKPRSKQNESFSGSINGLVENRNKRTVWTIPTQGYSEAHFATYPVNLIFPCIKAGCPEYLCKKCGKAKEKIYEEASGGTKGHSWHDHSDDMGKGNAKKQTGSEYNTYKRGNFINFTNCGCKAGFESGIVLDPFMGSGTTAIVAERLNRRWIGIEINKEYCDIAVKRIKIETAQYRFA